MRIIDADELINNIDCSADMGGALGKVVECVKYYAKYMVATAPTIEPKKGKWIYHDDDDMRFDTYHCSVCGKHFTVDAERFDDIGFVRDDLKYCPNCGADMRGEEHETD